EILQQPAQQAPIGPDAERTGYENQIKALAAGERREIGLEPEQQLVDPEAADVGRHCAAVESGDFEQRHKNILDSLERCVDLGDELRLPIPAHPSSASGGETFDEARDIEPGGIQRLNNVMARGGKESRFRQIGGLGG